MVTLFVIKYYADAPLHIRETRPLYVSPTLIYIYINPTPYLACSLFRLGPPSHWIVVGARAGVWVVVLFCRTQAAQLTNEFSASQNCSYFLKRALYGVKVVKAYERYRFPLLSDTISTLVQTIRNCSYSCNRCVLIAVPNDLQ